MNPVKPFLSYPFVDTKPSPPLYDNPEEEKLLLRYRNLVD